MKLSQYGIDFIKSWEKCRLIAYLDSSRVWTIGWGETGPGIKQGTNWTQQQADTSFATRSENLARQVSAYTQVTLSQNQFDALVSLTYNIGIEAYRNSTLLRMLNAGNSYGAADQILRWDHANSQVVEGLTKRRFAECTLFKTKDDSPCPPIPTPASPPTQSLAQWLKSIVSGFFTSRS